MNKGDVENRFSRELDNYINGINDNEPNSRMSRDHKELFKLGKILIDKDFSEEGNKEKIFNRTYKKLNRNKGGYIMKSNKFRKVSIAAACSIIICTGLIQTSFAEGLIAKVKKAITVGNITVIQTEDSKVQQVPVPDNLKGKIFDKHGNPINVFRKDYKGKMYTATGEEISSFSNGKIRTVNEDKKEDENNLIVKDPNELNKHTCFKVKLPSYIPKDYEFSRAEFYRDKNEIDVKDSKYIGIYFTNNKTGKFIYMQQRKSDKETAYETGTDGNIEKVKLNGVEGVLQDDKNLDWEYNNVLYGLSGKGNISKDELIKMAESIK